MGNAASGIPGDQGRRGRGVPAAASPPTGSPLQYSPALRRVTTGFGMGPGGATALSATGTPRPPRPAPAMVVPVRAPSHGSGACPPRMGCWSWCSSGLVFWFWCAGLGAYINHEARTCRGADSPLGCSPQARCPAWGTEPKRRAHGVVVARRPRSLGRVSSGRLPAVHLPPINPVISRGAYLIMSGTRRLGA